MNLEEHNNKFYEDTYYDIDVRLFIQAYHNIHNLKGPHIPDQIKLSEHHYKTLNEYEKVYLDLIKILDKYCEHFITLPVQNKHKVGLPIFLQLKEEYRQDNKGIQEILNKTTEPDYILLDLIYKEDGSYPEELTPPSNKQFLLKQINQHYMQEIFDTDDKYFTPDGNLNTDIIDIITYTEEHTELLRDDYE